MSKFEGGRQFITDIDRDNGTVTQTAKPGHEERLASAADALTACQGIKGVPKLLSATDDRIVTSYVNGSERKPFGSVQGAMHCGLALARLIASIHSRGYVHRDIKPCHVLVDSGSREIVLIDWGQAVRVGKPLECDRNARNGNQFIPLPEYAPAMPLESKAMRVSDMRQVIAYMVWDAVGIEDWSLTDGLECKCIARALFGHCFAEFFESSDGHSEVELVVSILEAMKGK